MRPRTFFLSTVTIGLAAALLQAGLNAPTAFAEQTAAARAGVEADQNEARLRRLDSRDPPPQMRSILTNRRAGSRL